MNLVIAMAIEEHREELRALFRDHRVHVYSEGPIEGFRPGDAPVDAANWFASRRSGVLSHVVLAFVAEDTAAELIAAVRNRNERRGDAHAIHAFRLPVLEAA